jgi:hypothetical protein
VARSRRAKEPLLLRGSPAQLCGVVTVPRVAEVPLSVDLDVPALEPPEVAVQDLEEGAARLALSLPRKTPPGTYEGRARIGGEERPVVLEVEPRIQLHVDPRRLYFRAARGSTVEADLTVTNLGNVACEIRATDAFGLFDTGGLDRAIGRAFSAELAEGERRVDLLADSAAEGFGGLVRIKVASGAGEIAPGGASSVHVAMTLPDRLEAGRLYWGTWRLYNVNYVVRVEVPAETRRRREGG